VEQLVSGYLSTVLLAALLFTIPPMLLYLSRLEGFPSKSTQERSACEKYFYFLAGPIFFIQVLGGGLVGVAQEWDFIKNPFDIPYRLASHIPGQVRLFLQFRRKVVIIYYCVICHATKTQPRHVLFVRIDECTSSTAVLKRLLLFNFLSFRLSNSLTLLCAC
jgi:hypothetical protein